MEMSNVKRDRERKRSKGQKAISEMGDLDPTTVIAASGKNRLNKHDRIKILN